MSDVVSFGWPLGFRPENVRVYHETATTICNGTRPGFTCGAIIATDGADDRAGTKCYGISSYESNAMKSANPHSGIYEAQTSRTLDLNGGNPACNQGGVAIVERHLFENHSQDARYRGPLDVCPMLPAQLGTGGNNQPFVVESDTVYCLQGNGIDRADTARCNGKGVKEDICYTLNTIDRPGVCYALSSKQQSLAVSENMANTLGANDFKEPQVTVLGYCDTAYGVDVRNMNEQSELFPTLQAKSNGGQSLNYSGAVRVRYIVRRLTPTECARLQGFPDTWGHPDKKEDFTEEEYRFWLDARNTHAAINGKAVKEYTKDQMLTWYNKLHTDSAEYKTWGNGIALPTALYVMQGIAEELEVEHDG